LGIRVLERFVNKNTALSVFNLHNVENYKCIVLKFLHQLRDLASDIYIFYLSFKNFVLTDLKMINAWSIHRYM